MIVKHPREYVVDKLQYALIQKPLQSLEPAVIPQRSAIKLLMVF